MDSQEIGIVGVYWIQLAQNRVQLLSSRDFRQSLMANSETVPNRLQLFPSRFIISNHHHFRPYITYAFQQESLKY
jgi:hypothetical protein